MVMMFVGGVVLMRDGTFRTIPTVEKLRGGSFSFPPKPIVIKLLSGNQYLKILSRILSHFWNRIHST